MTTRNPEPETRNTRRSRKIYILWAIALTLLLTAALFCWLVVVPVMGVRSALEEVSKRRKRQGYAVMPTDLKPTVERLGGPDKAAGLLCLYLRLPERLIVHRKLAIEALVVCKKPRALPVLVAALDDKDPEVRMRAALALAMLQHEARPAMKQLLSALKDPDVTTRAHAALALGAIGRDEEAARTALVVALQDGSDFVVLYAAGALLKTRPEGRRQGMAALHALLGKKSANTRCCAASTLVENGDPQGKGMELLIASLSPEQDEWVHQEAALNLGHLGPRAAPAVPALVRALGYKRTWIREQAAGALGDVGPKARAALPALEGLLEDKDASVRRSARKAIKKIKSAQEKE